jgi:hypothetical protein
MPRLIVPVLVGLAIILGAASYLYLRSAPESQPAQLEEYWPTEGWRTAEPADLDLDASRLSSMVDHIRLDIPTIDSVMVVRHGYVSERESVLAFPLLDGSFDYVGFASTDEDMRTFCLDLFNHYWGLGLEPTKEKVQETYFARRSLHRAQRQT